MVIENKLKAILFLFSANIETRLSRLSKLKNLDIQKTSKICNYNLNINAL